MNERMDLAKERLEYRGEHLREDAVPDDPMELMDAWMKTALAARDTRRTPENGVIFEPTALTLSTVEWVDGRPRPTARIVLLKDVTPAGFVIYTNYTSAKGSQLAANDQACMLFYWHPLFRQVRALGAMSAVSRAETEAYWATRPRGSQLGAWASPQSSRVDGLEELEASYAEAERRFQNQDVPCPPHWGGYRLVPDSVEFWQGQPSRMHDRLLYERAGAAWTRTRLAP